MICGGGWFRRWNRGAKLAVRYAVRALRSFATMEPHSADQRRAKRRTIAILRTADGPTLHRVYRGCEFNDINPLEVIGLSSGPMFATRRAYGSRTLADSLGQPSSS